MTESLESWLADADALRFVRRFALGATPGPLRYLAGREDDLYISLVDELFERLRNPPPDPSSWSALANGLAEFGFFRQVDEERQIPSDTALFSAAAFYLGGFSASAYLMLAASTRDGATTGHLAAHELLSRPPAITSPHVREIFRAVRDGHLDALREEQDRADSFATAALTDGPEEWVGWRLYQEVLRRFSEANVRRVLPHISDGFWDPLVSSFLRRTPPVWDFFPSQISAIDSGLVDSDATFSLQMPTGAGKTALTETAIFAHLSRNPDELAVLLVPYRALAAELRRTLVQRLNAMGFRSRSMYGGTIPTGDEIHALEDVRALVATPEALSGLLGADPSLLRRISLVVCDEGHLLDGPARGVALELLLARMRALGAQAPRFIFVSAIVPNIEEINSWLGGTDETVVRSTYRPALAEFARLAPTGSGRDRVVNLHFHPHEPSTFEVEGFLRREDFRYRAHDTGRQRTYPYTTIKTQAVAAARKALQLGSVVVFAANKRGNQGCVGLAEELLSQLGAPLSLPTPGQVVSDQSALQAAVEYLTLEYGTAWVGTRALRAGAVVHHGDVPQQTREVLESLIKDGVVALAFCTNTLAEGVNMPIRTIVLYSVQRRLPDGKAENLLARDIKNLVGRAGRAGSSTRGLVICANPQQWNAIEPAARQEPGEPVEGALLSLLHRLQTAVARQQVVLTNALLEQTPELYTLIDGVDATLIDLVAEEMTEAELINLAGELTSETYAAREAGADITTLMREVFQLRAQRVAGLRSTNRLSWIRETGARTRMVDSVETNLLPARERWDDVRHATDQALVSVVVGWAWNLPDVNRALREAYRTNDVDQHSFQSFIELWLAGRSLFAIAEAAGVTTDDALAVYSRVVAYELQTAVEQGIALLSRLCQARGLPISAAVVAFPEHLRFGVPNDASRMLATTVRHRRAAVALGTSDELVRFHDDAPRPLFVEARRLLDDTERWLPTLGRLVLADTTDDLAYYANQETNE